MSNQELAVYTAMDGQEISLTMDDVRNRFCSRASDLDIMEFMAVSKAMGANPYNKDTYLVGYNTKTGFKASTITSVHFANKVVQTHPDYDGIESGVVVINGAGQYEERKGAAFFPGFDQRLIGGWAEAYSKERSHPFRVTVTLSEYDTGKHQWQRMPATMIEKVAKMQAWRGLFPDSFQGVYSSEEMDQAREVTQASRPVPVQPVVQEPAPAPKPQLDAQQRAFMAQQRDRIMQATGATDAKEVSRQLMQACGNPLDHLGAGEWGDYEQAVLNVVDAMCCTSEAEEAVEPDEFDFGDPQ